MDEMAGAASVFVPTWTSSFPATFWSSVKAQPHLLESETRASQFQYEVTVILLYFIFSLGFMLFLVCIFIYLIANCPLCPTDSYA